MKNVWYGVVLASVVVACLAGPVSAQAPAKPDWREGFRTHDKNGDGKIDRAEFQDWIVDGFFQKDSNHKGYLTFDDVKDVMSPDTFKRYDRNGDGKIWLKDLLNAMFLDFEAADVNKDGLLTMEEIDNYIKRTGK